MEDEYTALTGCIRLFASHGSVGPITAAIRCRRMEYLSKAALRNRHWNTKITCDVLSRGKLLFLHCTADVHHYSTSILFNFVNDREGHRTGSLVWS